MPRQATKLQDLLEEQSYWGSFRKSDEWRLIAWSGLHTATFVHSDGHRYVVVDQGHLELLGLTAFSKSGGRDGE